MGKVTQELKYKRLKVGHACFVCRSKKIKCDGLSPCMQCKARGRQCRPGNADGSSELQIVDSGDSVNNSDTNSISSDDEAILFSWKKTPGRKPTAASKISAQNLINKKGQSRLASPPIGVEVLHGHATFGSFIKWTEEPPLPRNYSCPIEMPPSKLQMKMIDMFFKYRYPITPCIPKRYFYEQLRKKGPFVTPLLLNAMYCMACSCNQEAGLPKASVFYNRAKKLVDDFLDMPRLSTIVALSFMSLYEPAPTKGVTSNQQCRSWIHSGMAYRMCLELGINVDSEHTRGNLSPQEIELRRRIFWYCYCLDKIQSAEWERAWILPASMARVCLPQTIPEDDEDERLIVNYYYEKIKLTLLVEHGIQIRAKLAIDKNGVLSSAYEQMEDFYSKVIAWRDGFVGLPKQGIEHCVSVDQVMSLPSDSPNLSHLFVLFYTILIDILFWLPETPVRLHEQRIYASQLIRCIRNLCNAPGVIARYEFLVHALISAIRVQGCYLEDPDHIISQQSWYYFNQSLELLQHFRKYSVIPDNATIIAKIPAIRKYSQDFQSFYNEYNSQPLQFMENINSPTDSGTPSVESPAKIYSNNVETNSFIPALNFPQPGTQESPEIGMNSNFADLAGGFGDNINDFTNRRQLWENELQQLNVYNTYDPCSRPMTPDDQLINTNWQDTTASTDFAWGLPIINPHPEMQYSPVYPVYTTDQHLSAPCSFSNTSSHPSTPEATNSVELNDLSNNAYSPYHSIPSYTQGTYYTH